MYFSALNNQSKADLTKDHAFWLGMDAKKPAQGGLCVEFASSVAARLECVVDPDCLAVDRPSWRCVCRLRHALEHGVVLHVVHCSRVVGLLLLLHVYQDLCLLRCQRLRCGATG